MTTRNKCTQCALLLFMAAGLLGINVAKADTKYWDGTALGTGVGTGWDAVTSWSTDANNPDVDPTTIPGATDIASFNISSVNTDQIVNMYANQSVQGLNFTSTGLVTIQGGDANHALTLGTSGVTVSGSNGEITVGSPTNTSGQRVSMTLSGSQTWTNNGAGTVLSMGNATNGAIAPATGGGNITLTLDGTNTAISTLTPHLNNSNAVYGPITNGGGGEVLSIVKNGTGAWVLNNTGNTFSGGVTLNSGILAIQATGAGSTVGTGTLTLNGGELHPSGGFTSSVGLTNSVVVSGNVTIDPTRVAPTLASNMYFTGPWSSTGTPGNGPVVTIANRNDGAPGTIGFKLGVDFSAFTGTIKPLQFPAITGGTVISWYGTGAQSLNLSNAKFDVETSTGSPIGINNDQVVSFNVVSNPFENKIKLGELSGNGRIASNAAATSFVIEVGALNTNSVFSGDIVQRYTNAVSPAGDASEFNLRKVGTGSLTMSGDNSYIGDTTIANGTLVAGIDALVSKANVSKTATALMSITSNTFDNSASSPGTPHGLSDGDRVFIESFTNGFSDTNVLMNAQPFYVVNSTPTTFQLSLTQGGSVQTFADEPFGGAAVAMPTAFGAGITPIALGDGTGGAVKLLAGTATTPTVTIARDVTVAAGGGTPTLGSEVNGNSVYSGAITLNKDLSLTSASTGGNALTVSGPISSTGAFGVTKIGSGKAVLSSSSNSYSGDTKVQGGTLSITNAYLADAADVYLTTGSLFNLNFAGTDTIDSLFIDSAIQATGTWGGVGSGATHISPLLSGTGLLLVSTGGSLAGDYNGNGKVDAADYVVWRKNPGAFGGAAGYNTWRNNFGNPPGSGSAFQNSLASVPEPACGLPLIATIVGWRCRRRR